MKRWRVEIEYRRLRQANAVTLTVEAADEKGAEAAGRREAWRKGHRGQIDWVVATEVTE